MHTGEAAGEPCERATPFSVVLLAAGESSRMGQSKMLLRWGETSVLGHLISLWEQLGAMQIAVVCATHDHQLAAELDRLRFPNEDRICNPEPQLGMFSSIQCAARWGGWRADGVGWVIVLGDQPHLRRSTLAVLLHAAKQNPGSIWQPSRNGRRRHPVWLPAAAFSRLGTATHRTLREFLDHSTAEIRSVEIDDPGLDLDLDSPADYDRAVGLACSDPGKDAAFRGSNDV